MAEEKAKPIEREYVIPLRRSWLIVPDYRRAGRAAKTIKEFIAKHMKVPERDINKVKLNIYLNQELWFHGKTGPPSKIKVKAIKEGDIVKVELVELPSAVKFAKAKHERAHKAEEKKAEKKEEKVEAKEEKKEETKAEKGEKKEEEKEKAEEKKAEVEKEKSGEETQIKEAKQEKRAEKHVTKKGETQIVRRSMNRH
jgi:large subunit ribosomal protein L31e